MSDEECRHVDHIRFPSYDPYTYYIFALPARWALLAHGVSGGGRLDTTSLGIENMELEYLFVEVETDHVYLHGEH